jgi:hypothetical protein
MQACKIHSLGKYQIKYALEWQNFMPSIYPIIMDLRQAQQSSLITDILHPHTRINYR